MFAYMMQMNYSHSPVLLIALAGVFVLLLIVTATQHRRYSAMTQQKLCRGCGASHPAHAQFCRRCGRKL